MITIYKNIFAKEPYYLTIEQAFERIKNGNSLQTVTEIRATQDKEKAKNLKNNLPSVCFSGEFKERKDELIINHSGFLILDFDKLENPIYKKQKLFEKDFIKAAWISPSGNGVKALVKIADGKKHREHFAALQDIFPEIDKSGINESRVCFESFDPEILIKENEKTFTKIKTTEKGLEYEKTDSDETFKRIMVWLNNSGSAFVSGERNLYVYKLAAACCRFGISEINCISLIGVYVSSGGSDFSKYEINQAIKSAYKSNVFGTAEFKNEKLVDKSTYSEIKIDPSVYDISIKPKDVIYGIDCKQDALNLYRNGYEKVLSTGCLELDEFFHFKKGELTLLTGIGNYGKSTFMKFLLLIQILKGHKIAVFSPEDAPAHEFYNDFVEIYFGSSCVYGENKPTESQYEQIYDLITKNIFFIYPKDIAPTPDYIKERFLELIIKEKVEFCMIDPFNQMTNEYSKNGGRSDKYLETLLSDFGRFSKVNDVYFLIIAHPKALQKQADGNYPCPDVFDIADGAMWNNKMDNILVYHLPYRQSDNQNTVCEFHSKKIRKRKVVGNVGNLQFDYLPLKRRFIIGGRDYIDDLIHNGKSIQQEFNHSQIKPNLNFDEPLKDQYGNSEVPF